MRRVLLLSVLINLLFVLGAFAVYDRLAIPPTGWPPPAAGEFPAAGGAATTGEETIPEIVAKTEPAVVSVIAQKDVPVLERYYERFNPFGPLGSPFEFQIPRLRERGTEEREIGGGSGFLVSADGLVLTNRHVVEDLAASYIVLTNDNQKHAAEVVARDPFLDIAVLKIRGNNFPYLVFGDSDALKLGQAVIVIGNALGEFRNSVSAGVISGLGRRVVAGDSAGRSELLEEVVQTDAAINPGNSGGPLLNLRGEVVGVNVAMALGSENIGFSLPANLVKGAVESVRRYGEIVRPFLGVRYVQITKTLQEENQLPFDYGVLVVRGAAAEELAVIPGSPADKAGIVENDIILSADGVKLDSGNSLGTTIRQKKVGDRLVLRLSHKEGGEKTVTVVLERFRL